MVVIAVAMVAATANSWNSASVAHAGQPAADPACSTTNLTLTNQNPYKIWLGENVQTGAILTPPGNNWEMAPAGMPGDSISLCVPGNWTSGTFWARTECNFAAFKDPDDDYVKCTSQSECCTTGTTCNQTGEPTKNNHICYGGMCVIDCSTPPPGNGTDNGTDGDCSALPNSVCVGAAGSVGADPNASPTPRAANYTAGSFCGFTGGVCRTGDCGSGLSQCQGSWALNSGSPTATPTATAVAADFGPETPASQFEITNNSLDDGGLGAATYDVTNLAGYNGPINVTLDFTPGPHGNSACVANGCLTDLNTGCPSLLQVIEPPTSNVTPVSCGTGTYCQTGACETCPKRDDDSCAGGFTCVIGCNGPGKLCGNSYPSPVSAPGVTKLECDTTIPDSTVHGIQLNADGSQYRDMYDATNDSNDATGAGTGHQGVTMFSGNQGTPTCWGDVDCLPGEECLIGPTATGITGLPAYVGICATPSSGGLPATIPIKDCMSTNDETKHCGGYPSSPVYTCVAATNVESGVACLPAYDPATVGLGTFDSNSGFFDGIGAPINLEWEAAALWAAGTGTTTGTTPYYQTFSNACPHQYAWTYDDHTGGLACNGYPLSFTVAFGQLSGSPSPTATPSPSATATSSATATATSTSSGTPTLTATATATPTATATATSTATPSATSTSTASATTSGTPTATATSTGTATPTPTMTPTPSGTATPGCAPSFLYLTTNPDGTLAFGDVKATKSVTESLMVTNSEPPGGGLALTTKIQGGNSTDFKVKGGNCTTINRLKAGATCTYNLRLKSDTKGVVSSNITITGTFKKGVCPSGDVQNVTVHLAGDIN